MSAFSVITNMYKKYKRATPKQLVLTGVFALSLAAAIGGGFASKQHSSAAVFYGRDPDVTNSIMKSGSVGCLTKEECYNDIKGNQPADLQGIYNHFGLQNNEYDRFLSTAKEGIAYKNGTIVVDGKVVMNGTWSIGRSSKSYSWNLPISGVGTYHASMSTQVQGSDLPVYVMFDSKGVPEFVVMKACGNPMGGNKPSAACKMLNVKAVDGKKNTYKFNAQVDTDQFGLAKVVKLDYYYNDGDGEKHFATTSSAGEFTAEKTFTKAAKVTVKVTVDMPGFGEVVVTSIECEKEIGVVEEEFFYVCEALVKTTSDNRTYRFTVKTTQSDGVTVKSADFVVDNSVTTTGVTTKENGNIYRDYTFTDTAEHTVKVKQIVFVVNGNEKVAVTTEGKCVANVNGKTPECKPGIPVGDKRCEELPKTGPAGAAGLFVGVSAFGAAAHRLVMRHRARRSEQDKHPQPGPR